MLFERRVVLPCLTAQLNTIDVVKDMLLSCQIRRKVPELNPQEGVWNLLKRRELKNLCCHTLSQLQNEIVLAKERLHHRRYILQICFFHALGTA